MIGDWVRLDDRECLVGRAETSVWEEERIGLRGKKEEFSWGVPPFGCVVWARSGDGGRKKGPTRGVQQGKCGSGEGAAGRYRDTGSAVYRTVQYGRV